ncbi:ArsR family transcriptional regulator [Gordonia oryzae]|uniref:ArsR family transcriptional regulator n=1 Tax=Gordonia oryzae TaxID=2487349 RepID=A0A3N4GKQ6_9ACTN|nr:ArsR family transcriptional regulator [Gordonia oryzae]
MVDMDTPRPCDALTERTDAQAREAASDLLRALAAPTRIAIVLSLQESAKCVHELVGGLGLSQPLVSQHLRVLKDAGVVRGHRNGREIMYELIDDHLAHIVTDALVHATESSVESELAGHHESVDATADPADPVAQERTGASS